MKLKFLAFALLIFTLGYAQNNATVTGTVTDKEMNNDPLPFASVVVKGTSIGTNTDENGKYSLKIPAGTQTLVFAFLGYESVEINITIKAGETQTINQALASTSVQLNDVVIEQKVNREKESALLLEQKNAAVITQNIGAQELSRKGVSDAATAVTKVTGISKQEGNSGIFVRGLGDRYNSTMLNGLPLPSNEPENKNIALDLFSTDIIQSVSVNKTYNVFLYGDMAGANVDIISKEHIGPAKLDVEIGSGLNNNAFNTDFKTADGMQKSGFYNLKTPTSVKEYQFTTKWSPNSQSNPLNANFSIAGGNRYNVGENGRLSFFATAAYTNGYRYKNGFQRVVNNTNESIPVDYYNVDKYEFSTKTTGMANVVYKINDANTIKFNSVFVNASKSSVNEYDSYIGLGEDRYEFDRQTLTEQNKLFVNQLLGEHTLNERLSVDWGASYNTVNADMPDRITDNLTLRQDGTYLFNTAAATSNNRYYQFIDENEFAGKALATYKLFKADEDKYKGKLTFGYNGRIKSRDFEATQLNFKISGADNINADINDLDAFLNASNQALEQNVPGTFFIGTGRGVNLKPFTYNGDLSVHAGVLNFEHSPSDKFTYTIGLRGEKVLQKLEWNTNYPIAGASFDDATIDKTFILPSASIKYSINDKQNFRVGISKTYTLPQFKEKAPFRYEGVGESSVGNPFLKPSDNYNLDIKWEMFPKNDELISATAFGKYIKNPMSRVLLNSALNDNTFVNAGDYAYVAGLEIEIKKNIWTVNEENNKKTLSGGLNATVMYDKQELDPDKVPKDTNNTLSVNFNDSKDGLQGASPFIFNADLTYQMESGKFRPTVSVVGNYFHDRIYSLGTFDRGNIVEKGVMQLNLITHTAIGERFTVGFSVKNILDSKIRRVQENAEGDIDTYNFREGVNFSLSLKYSIF